MNPHRSKLILLFTALILASLPAAEASARTAPSRAHSFEGTCAVVGIARLDHPVTVAPSPNRVVYRAKGTCSGRLDGHRLSDGGVPVAVVSAGDKITGCTATLVPRLATTLTFYPSDRRRRRSIRASGKVTFVGRNMAATGEGRKSGLWGATGTIQGGPELVQTCLQGKLRAIGISIDLVTVTPLVG